MYVLQVAKMGGGEQAGQQLAFLWAKTLGGDSAVKLLTKFGLLETSIDYACDSYQVWLKHTFVLNIGHF